MQTLKGECRDVVTKLEVLASRAVGLHKVRDVCEVLDAGEVLDEGVANKDSEEMTYLCARSSVPEGGGRYVWDSWENMQCVRKDCRWGRDVQVIWWERTVIKEMSDGVIAVVICLPKQATQCMHLRL